MKIKDIIGYIHGRHLSGTLESDFDSIAYDSRRVKEHSLFIAVSGYTHDGHSFISDAINRGACCIIGQNIPDNSVHENVTFIKVQDSRKALAQIAQIFYHNPSSYLTCIGITGTNGKTTTCHIVKSIIEAQKNVKAGMSGTIHNLIGSKCLPASHTTPESLELQQLLRQMVDEGCTSAVIEVSSHALALSRLEGCCLKIAAITNFSRDHLDFHNTQEDYFFAKMRIFDYLSRTGSAVINIDDPWLRDMGKTLSCPVITCGTDRKAMVRAQEVTQERNGLSLTVKTPSGEIMITSPLMGSTNVENILISVGIAWGLRINLQAIEKGIREMKPVTGRFEQVKIDEESNAIIDYAHTDDALGRVLREARAITHRKLITVFGCGGDRDKGKRPLMGRVASELSDRVIVTSDNPRNENPMDIINDIVKGMKGNHYKIVSDRKKAIIEALTMAQSGDTVIIAGKGHEDYQEIKGIRYPFNDRDIVKDFLAQKKESSL
jgi:UDP-N-acetylmuramoyl-L-alanyl-D-glutamate--2,6-diaminopimelate ligase